MIQSSILEIFIYLHCYFVNICLNDPIGFSYIHSRRFHEDHKCFIETIHQAVPSLSSTKTVIVTNRAFAFSDVLPVFCWNHLKRDLQFYLRNKANSTATDINYFVNAFQSLITECTETEFDQA